MLDGPIFLTAATDASLTPAPGGPGIHSAFRVFISLPTIHIEFSFYTTDVEGRFLFPVTGVIRGSKRIREHRSDVFAELAQRKSTIT